MLEAKRQARKHAARAVMLAVALGMALGACTTSRQTRGYIMDEELIANIATGVDNRNSVREMLGNPSSTSAFGAETWYYISRETVTQGFLKERPLQQRIVEIRFSDGGDVAEIKEYTLADAKRITPAEEITPIRGKTLGFFEQLLQGVGRVGPGLGTGPGGPGGPQRRRPPGT